jgi:hypothetical protein
MPSDTPTTEAGRSLVDHYRRGLTFPMEWTEMLVRVRGIEAEAAEKAVRSFAERARREVERLPWNPDDGSVPFDGGEWAVGEYRSAVLALLQAETPDAAPLLRPPELVAPRRRAVPVRHSPGQRPGRAGRRTAGGSAEHWPLHRFDGRRPCLGRGHRTPIRRLPGAQPTGERDVSRSLVCSIAEHRSCDGFAPNGSDTPCECACQHIARLTTAERDEERQRAQQRARRAVTASREPRL